MGDEISEFCQSLGLAKNGYLDEQELEIVCNRIGVDVPAGKIKDLFEELDADHDGKICVAELSKMFQRMENRTPSRSPPKGPLESSPVPLERPVKQSNGLFRYHPGEKSPLSYLESLDPENTGFTRVGCILDMWAPLAINEKRGLEILNEMGFRSLSRSNSVNLQLFAKAMEEELDRLSGSGIPTTIQIVILAYQTEAQYLRSVVENLESERDQLKKEILEAHQRSEKLAQDVDEQNACLEKTNQRLMQKLEAKYLDQIQEIQKRSSLEKDSLQQTIFSLETQERAIREEELRQRSLVTRLTQENSNLEKDVQILSSDIQSINRLKDQFEKEVSRLLQRENTFLEIETKNSEALIKTECELRKARLDLQTLQDQNDELSIRLVGLKEELHSLKNTEKKRYFGKRRKNDFRYSNVSNGDVFSDDVSNETTDVPVEKFGKYNRQEETNMSDSALEDDRDMESLFDPSFRDMNQSDSEDCQTLYAMSLEACMGESSTDPSAGCSETPVGSTTKFGTDYSKSLESEMDSVKRKITTILTEKEELLRENSILKSQNKNVEFNWKRWRKDSVDAETQTSSELSDGLKNESLENETSNQIQRLETELLTLKKEKENHQGICENYEKSLELMQTEYEKCEEYWHGKLQEARDEYELERTTNDDKFQELLLKIQEYENMFLKQENFVTEKLPPIDECVSFEKQVSDLEEECQHLRDELVAERLSQEAAVTSLQRKFEAKLSEETGNLEQQVSALTKKCFEYERRLSQLAEQEAERSNFEDVAMLDMLKSKINQLELQLKGQNVEERQKLADIWTNNNNDQTLNGSASGQSIQEPKRVRFQTFQNPSPDLLEILNRPEPLVESEQKGSSASLPYFSAQQQCNYQPKRTEFLTSLPPTRNGNDWGETANIQNKKAWCHVEFGWLQGLRAKLRQKDEQCIILQRVLQQKEVQTERILDGMRNQYASELYRLESLLKQSEMLCHQHAQKCNEQAEKLAHSDLLVKDLWLENAKLLAALNSTEERVVQLENLLKFQMSSLNNNSVGTAGPTQSLAPSQHSLPHSLNYFH